MEMSLLDNIRITLHRYLRAFFIPDSTLHSRQRWILGLINLSAVVIFWVSSSFLVNAIVEDDSYRKPFFITYLNTSCFCFYIIPYLLIEGYTVNEFIQKLLNDYELEKIKKRQHKQEDDEGLLHSNYGSDDNLSENRQPSPLHVVMESSDLQSEQPDPSEISTYETVKLSLQFLILWFSANFVTNSSLSYTSVASQTILSSTSSFFTLIIGYLVSVEQINKNKIIGILLSFTGVLLVTKIDTSQTNPNNSSPNNKSSILVLWGNILALSGALIYGIYTILLKFKISIPNSKREKNLNTHLFFGFVGIFSLFLLWPIIIILHWTGVERFSLPPNTEIWAIVGINALITFISDFCWCNAVLLTSPLTVTVGLSMTIPLAMVGDWVIKGFRVNGWYVFGAAIVTAGFLIINKDEEEDFVVDE